MLSSLLQDLRVGARNLLASPRFALVASLTLAGVFIAAALLLGAIILGASAVPAYRSSRAEPSHALRAQ